MRKILLAMFICLVCIPAWCQLDLYSPEYKALYLIVNNIDYFINDPVFQKYVSHEKRKIFYNEKKIAINYSTMRKKFGIDTTRRYSTELHEPVSKSNYSLYDVKDSAHVHIARGDLIISIFEPSYYNGYIYIMAFARNDQSTYGDRISNYLIILNNRMRLVKFYYIKGII